MYEDDDDKEEFEGWRSLGPDREATLYVHLEDGSLGIRFHSEHEVEQIQCECWKSQPLSLS